MKITKALALVFVAVFLFAAVGLCGAASSTDDGDGHCANCCTAGCCNSAILSSTQSLAAPSFSTSLIQFDAVLRQEIFLSGIEYPPNSLI